MARHELEIVISPDGVIEVEVKGAKGKKCLEYLEVFNSVGIVTDKRLTGEYYAPESEVSITNQTRTRFTN